jgi:hypothetical protein
MFMKTTGNGLTLIALSTGGASLVRVAATIVAAFGSASEEKGASASAGALISNQKVAKAQARNPCAVSRNITVAAAAPATTGNGSVSPEAAEAARKAAAAFAFYSSLSLLIGAFIASVAGGLGGFHRDEV